MGDYLARRYTAQDGISLYFRDYPAPTDAQGETAILCLSGLARNSKDFAFLAPEIAAGALGPPRRVICPDYRGRGRSDPDPDPANYKPETYLNDIRHLLMALGLHRVIVIGASLGGLLGMGLGVAAPPGLAGLVLNDVGPEISGAGMDRIIDYLKSDRRHPSLEAATAELRAIFKQPGWSDEDWRIAAAATFIQREDGLYHVDWDPQIAAPMTKGAPIPDLWRYFKAVTRVPLLALRGEFSDILTDATLQGMAAAHPGAVTVTIIGAGHTPTLNEPDSRKALYDFLSRCDRRAGGPDDH